MDADTHRAESRHPRRWTVYVCPSCDRIFKQASDAPAPSGICHHAGEPVTPEEVHVIEADHLHDVTVIVASAASYVGSTTGLLAHLSDAGTVPEADWERARAVSGLLNHALEILTTRSTQ